MRVAYFQCIGGAAGDMVLSALVDAGLPRERLEEELAKVPVGGFSMEFREAARGGVTGTHLTVNLDRDGRRKRDWRQFLDLVDASRLSPTAKERSSTIFRRLWEAEARAHESPVEDVHLHELGTLDTLVDVVGSVVGLELLGVERVYSSPLPSGSGIIESEHGSMPAPSPATMQLMAEARAVASPPPAGRDVGLEMVTPTGAAILTAMASFRQPTMQVESVGYGAGTKDTKGYPNVLAIWIGEEVGSEPVQDVVLLETNLDDASPDVLGYVHERLLDLGAADVWFTPIQMKKNRPAVMLSALVSPSLQARATDLLMRETTTLGVRVRPVMRHRAEREMVDLETSLGPARVKLKKWGDEVIDASPEYEDCRRLAMEHSMPLQDVLRLVKQEASRRFLD